MQKSRELAQRNLPDSVRTADVVITNPTHIAVALKYDINGGNEPILVAKGSDHLAKVIRDYASEYGVPMIENKPIARALYFNVEIGEPIPEDMFEAVAIIYSKLAKFRQAVSA